MSEVEPSGNAGYSFGFSSEPPKDPPMASFNQPSTVQAASTQQKISATGQAPAPPLSPVGTQSQVSQPQQSAADSLFGSANRKQNKLDVRIGKQRYCNFRLQTICFCFFKSEGRRKVFDKIPTFLIALKS